MKNLHSDSEIENLNPSAVSEPSPTPIAEIFRSEAKLSSRASERAAPPEPLKQVVVDRRARLEGYAREIRAEMAKLPDTAKARHVDARRRQKLGARLTSIEKEILKIKQMRLF